MAATDDLLCSWCRSAAWLFKCSMCDPRKEKTLCSRCSILWHSRGFARSHQLTSNYGKTLPFLVWSQGSAVTNGESKATTRIHTDLDSLNLQDQELIIIDEDYTPLAVAMEEKEMKANGSPTVKSTETELVNRNQRVKENQIPEKGYEFAMAKNSLRIDEDDVLISVERDKQDVKANRLPTQNMPAVSTTQAKEKALASGTVGTKKEEKLISGEHEDHKKPLPSYLSSPSQSSASATAQSKPLSKTSVPVSRNLLQFPTHGSTSVINTDAAYVGSVPGLTPLSLIHDQVLSASTSTRASADTSSVYKQTKTTSQTQTLEDLLRCFPSPDHMLMETLASRIEDALAIEDALICASIGNCQEPQCRSVLLHYEHCKRDKMCGDSKCSEISTIYIHNRNCASKLKPDGKKSVCPFCIRIRQRRSFGVCAALNHLISDQQRVLRTSQIEATRNSCLRSIQTMTERVKYLFAESDRLNQLASESCIPIFNFPKYQWHLSDDVNIKVEPPPLEMGDNIPSDTVSSEEMIRRAKQSPSAQNDSIPGTSTFNATFINQLLRAKSERGESGEVAQRKFDEVLKLGYAIVDACFCAPSRAQRCLLNCKSILDHLQHHLDLKICKHSMCGAVEHHFAHLSDCEAHAQSKFCEYCLRMDERRLIRSVDFMEVEQPDAEAKVQKIINDITALFTNHRRDEREQEMIQLEDELEQAEVYKQELYEKLETGRSELQRVHRNMAIRGFPATSSGFLPNHFTKSRRASYSGSNKKRRFVDIESSIK
ncbi:Zinc finger, TAZ-type [Plasmopara halstedii]|uniref:Zinc finger, TAZ-type n=1 Tax=Plasmopara halstedii TaxID=4781 RepID=A0A0P1A3W3_PLAHL|nr:Zinc finger, TAZ-type [Plasmopara halstedii]CEG35097.1 Zinc finger, TAZ-type [Plasmopara halstedii]|eukprot:XP_024571466.1 Zinc finger, TAZ-type [Plasmopara halstedii]